MENILEVKNLNKKYNSFELKDVSFAIPKGKVLGFIGENGAGKTTTIKAILNLINLNSGNVKIFNKDIIQNEKSIKEKIGAVLDDSFFPDTLTALDINKIMKKIYNLWNEKQFLDYLKNYKLPINQIIKDYSTGMLMKLKIFTALSHNPELLILDEPTSGLDPVVRADILDLFKKFMKDDNHSIFISSHITSDLEHIADDIIFIKDGSILLNESLTKIKKDYGIINCKEKAFNKIKSKDIIKYIIDNDAYRVLVKNKTKIKKEYNLKKIDDITLEELMVLYIRGN